MAGKKIMHTNFFRKPVLDTMIFSRRFFSIRRLGGGKATQYYIFVWILQSETVRVYQVWLLSPGEHFDNWELFIYWMALTSVWKKFFFEKKI